MFGTYLATSTRILWRLLERYGVEPAPVFREAGLDPARMDHPRTRYPLERVWSAWERSAGLIDDPCCGLRAADCWSPTDFHALGYAFCASSTLRTALERLIRYSRVISDALEISLRRDGDAIELTDSRPMNLKLRPPVLDDAGLAVITAMCRHVCAEQLDPSEVALVRSQPPCASDYFGYFRCPVRFGASVTFIRFPDSAMDRPLPAANRELARINDRVLTELIARLRKDDLISRVKAAVVEHLPSGAPNAEDIARDLHLTPRTLQRRLADAGTTYSEILEAVRRELAEHYLEAGAMPLGEISYLLGFSELAGFSRAFKRWTGRSPSTYREEPD